MVWLDRLGHGVVGFGLVLVIGYVACKYALRRRSMARKGQSSNTADKKTGLPDKDSDAITSVACLNTANFVSDSVKRH
jgi:hypothetical protein